jgi:hypothetical protein
MHEVIGSMKAVRFADAADAAAAVPANSSI